MNNGGRAYRLSVFHSGNHTMHHITLLYLTSKQEIWETFLLTCNAVKGFLNMPIAESLPFLTYKKRLK